MHLALSHAKSLPLHLAKSLLRYRPFSVLSAPPLATTHLLPLLHMRSPHGQKYLPLFLPPLSIPFAYAPSISTKSRLFTLLLPIFRLTFKKFFDIILKKNHFFIALAHFFHSKSRKIHEKFIKNSYFFHNFLKISRILPLFSQKFHFFHKKPTIPVGKKIKNCANQAYKRFYLTFKKFFDIIIKKTIFFLAAFLSHS